MQRWILGEEHSNALASTNSLAICYDEVGLSKKAAQLYKEVLEARKGILGEEHPETLTSMGNFAVSYRGLSRLKEAVQLDEKVVEARERTLGNVEARNGPAATRKILGEEHPNTLALMANLTSCYDGLGQSKEAVALHEKVLVARERILGEEQPDTL
ncbi:MAG: hypothetical protein M1839_000451 [Geoglossum umbratile]|nr:MAG: hypothetical protein M1839_000451 [Geoglossum umbratile]